MFFEDILFDIILAFIELEYFWWKTTPVIFVYKNYNNNCVRTPVSLHVSYHVYLLFVIYIFRIFSHCFFVLIFFCESFIGCIYGVGRNN